MATTPQQAIAAYQSGQISAAQYNSYAATYAATGSASIAAPAPAPAPVSAPAPVTYSGGGYSAPAPVSAPTVYAGGLQPADPSNQYNTQTGQPNPNWVGNTAPAPVAPVTGGTSIGQYKGTNITAGTDAQIQAQIKAIDAQDRWIPEQATTKTPIIETDTLKNNPVVNLPDQPIPTDYSSILKSLNGTNETNIANAGINANTQNNNDILKQFQDLIGTPPSTADSYQKAQEQTKLLQQQQTVNDLTTNLNQIVAQGQTASLGLESQAGGKGVTTAFLGRQQQEITRQTAIQALPVSAQLQAAQGNLATATQNMNTLFKIYSDDATNAYNYRVQVATAFKEVATSAENKKLDLFLNQITDQHNQNLSFINQKQDLATQAMANGATASVLSSIAQATTYEEALMAVGPYGVKPQTGTESQPIPNLFTSQQIGDMQGGGLDVQTATLINLALQEGHSLDEIRQELRNTGRDPVVLDVFDRVNNIKKVLGQPTTATEKATPASVIGKVRALKDANAPLQDILDFINFSGYDTNASDIQDIIKDYSPAAKTFKWPWQK